MAKYVALLRGIGPGDPNMTSEKFKTCFSELGFENVQIVIASGNVIFESSNTNAEKLAEIIEEGLPLKLGFSRMVIVKSKDQLQKVLDQHPYKSEHNQKTYLLITFSKKPFAGPTSLAVVPAGKPYLILRKDKDVIYGLVDMTKGKTPDYMSWLEKQFGKDITSRALKTIERILVKMS